MGDIKIDYLTGEIRFGFDVFNQNKTISQEFMQFISSETSSVYTLLGVLIFEFEMIYDNDGTLYLMYTIYFTFYYFINCIQGWLDGSKYYKMTATAHRDTLLSL